MVFPSPQITERLGRIEHSCQSLMEILDEGEITSIFCFKPLRFWIVCYCSIIHHILTNTKARQACISLQGVRIPILLKPHFAQDSFIGNKITENRILVHASWIKATCFDLKSGNRVFYLETSIWKAGSFPLRVNWIWCQVHTHGINWLLYFQQKVSKLSILVTHVKQTLPHGLWFSRKLLLNELLNIHLPGWGDGRGRMEKHTHVLRIALFVLLFFIPKAF